MSDAGRSPPAGTANRVRRMRRSAARRRSCRPAVKRAGRVLGVQNGPVVRRPGEAASARRSSRRRDRDRRRERLLDEPSRRLPPAPRRRGSRIRRSGCDRSPSTRTGAASGSIEDGMCVARLITDVAAERRPPQGAWIEQIRGDGGAPTRASASRCSSVRADADGPGARRRRAPARGADPRHPMLPSREFSSWTLQPPSRLEACKIRSGSTDSAGFVEPSLAKNLNRRNFLD